MSVVMNRRVLLCVLASAMVIIAGYLLTLAPAQARTPDGYTAIVTKSDYRKSGTQIRLANVSSPRPFVTWPGGSGAETNRVYEDDELIVLFFVASLTGSTETFYLYKKQKRFTLIEAAVLEASATSVELRPKVTHGVLK